MKLGSNQKVFLKPDVFSFSGKIIAIDPQKVRSKDQKKEYDQNLIRIYTKSGDLHISDWDILPCDIEVGDHAIVTCTGKDQKIQISKIETI